MSDLHQVGFADEGEAVVAHHLAHGIKVVATHHQHQLLLEVKAVHVLDVDAAACEELDHAGEVGGLGFDGYGDDVVHRDKHAARLQHVVGLLLVGGDETHQAVVTRVGYRSADNVYIGLTEDGQQFAETAELVFKKKGNLFDGHGIQVFSGSFACP